MAIEIPLSRGMKAFIDEDDFELVKGYKWIALSTGLSKVFYAAHFYNVDGKRHALLMHRLILGAKKGFVVDHINHNTLDNRRSNIRICTHGENMRNSKTRKNSNSGVRNVMFESVGGGKKRWRASIRVDGKRHRKWFDSKEAAEKWCESNIKLLHGEFAYQKEKDVRV